jgi:hypothetical protein
MRKNLFLLFLFLLLSACKSAKLYPDWSSTTWGPFNLSDPPGINNPVLSAKDVTDRDAQFVADPFLFYEGDTWYMFLEVFDRQTGGDIAIATSSDGLTWTYDRIVLDEPFHLSYPYVFKVDDSYYMIPETHQLSDVRLYQATHFPYEWAYVSTLLAGRKYVDPSIFQFNGRWWMFIGETENTTLYLFSSRSLKGKWIEHPKSPVILNDSLSARPGGRVFIYDGDKIIRVAESFGDRLRVRAYQIDLLTTRKYEEHEIPESPLLEPGDQPEVWYEAGMHQFDPWWTGEKWLVVYDGRAMDDVFSIGIKHAESH